MNKLKLEYVKCISSENIFFKKGKKYPIISYNNGITILGEMDKSNEHRQSKILFSYFNGTIADEEKSIIFVENYSVKNKLKNIKNFRRNK